jgi:hypothetical protein
MVSSLLARGRLRSWVRLSRLARLRSRGSGWSPALSRSWTELAIGRRQQQRPRPRPLARRLHPPQSPLLGRPSVQSQPPAHACCRWTVPFDGWRASWELPYSCGSRAVWVDEEGAGHVVFGPADTLSRRGRAEEIRDGGRNWQSASSGLEVPWPRHMVERFLRVGNQLLAVLSHGHVLAAPIELLQRTCLLPDAEGISAVALTPVHSAQ